MRPLTAVFVLFAVVATGAALGYSAAQYRWLSVAWQVAAILLGGYLALWGFGYVRWPASTPPRTPSPRAGEDTGSGSTSGSSASEYSG
jgi:hypothetical protein